VGEVARDFPAVTAVCETVGRTLEPRIPRFRWTPAAVCMGKASETAAALTGRALTPPSMPACTAWAQAIGPGERRAVRAASRIERIREAFISLII
jgi:hypothetical protein